MDIAETYHLHTDTKLSTGPVPRIYRFLYPCGERGFLLPDGTLGLEDAKEDDWMTDPAKMEESGIS